MRGSEGRAGGREHHPNQGGGVGVGKKGGNDARDGDARTKPLPSPSSSLLALAPGVWRGGVEPHKQDLPPFLHPCDATIFAECGIRWKRLGEPSQGRNDKRACSACRTDKRVQHHQATSHDQACEGAFRGDTGNESREGDEVERAPDRQRARSTRQPGGRDREAAVRTVSLALAAATAATVNSSRDIPCASAHNFWMSACTRGG